MPFISLFKLSKCFEYSRTYCKKLLDKRYSLNNIEYRTSTTIKIPQYGDIQIKGLIEVEVANARDEVQAIVGEIRENTKALQFLSIPLRNKLIKEKFNLFKNDILSEDDNEDSEESIFISPDKLHLTIAVFCLLNADEKQEAIKALNDYKRKFLRYEIMIFKCIETLFATVFIFIVALIATGLEVIDYRNN